MLMTELRALTSWNWVGVSAALSQVSSLSIQSVPSSVSMKRLCDSLTFLSRPSSSMPLYFMVGFLPSRLPVS